MKEDMSLVENRCIQLPQNRLINIEFKDLSHRIPIRRQEPKLILKEVSGEFKPGELTAIIGQSGSGKTTLLNLLAGYKIPFMEWKRQETSGSILINGRLRTNEELSKISKYIMQESHVLQALTVHESMMVAANLKLGRNSLESKIQTISTILSSLCLDSVKNNRISSLSGGEKKRLSVGLELVDNPSVLFLDEPTTGLDEHSSTQCVQILKKLAKSGRTIVCSIHSPSARIFSFFDHVYVLSKGQCVYRGNSFEIVRYLSDIDLNCPSTYNPADFIIEVCNGDYGDFQDHLVSMIGNGKLSFDTSNIGLQEIDTEEEMLISDKSWYGANWTSQFQILWKRMWLKSWRDKKQLLSKIICNILFSILIGLLYKDMGQDRNRIMEIYKGFSAISLFVFYLYGIPTLYELQDDLRYSKSEHFNRWYSFSSYYCALSLSTLHLHFISALFLVSTLFILEDLPLELFRLTVTVAVLFLAGLIAESIGQALITALNLLSSLFTYTVFLAVLLLLQIYEIGRKELPILIDIGMHLSALKYTISGIVSSIFEDRKTPKCPVDYCHFSHYKDFLNKIGPNNYPWLLDIIALVIMFIVMKIIGYCLLSLKLRKRTNSWLAL